MLSLLTNAATISILSLIGFLAGYYVYARYLSQTIFQLDPSETTPAHEHRDGVDFVPANKHVLFGHHFCSITGAAPIVGPAVAVIWGWLPAVLWVVFGTIFIGAVHDFGTLVLSARREGRSIGDICGDLIGERSQTLFLILVAILIWVVLAVFAVVISILFVKFPQSVVPIHFEILVAVTIGIVVYRLNWDLTVPSIIALFSLYGIILLTLQFDALKTFRIHQIIPFSLEQMTWMSYLGFQSVFQREVFIWVVILLVYSFIASTIPVWVLLQPRDFINSHLLFVGLGAVYVGLFISAPQIKSPAWNPNVKNPGTLARVNEQHVQNLHGDLPEGLTLVPPEDSSNPVPVISEINRVSELSPRFYLVTEGSRNPLKKGENIPVRSVTKREGEHYNGPLVPVLTPDGKPVRFRNGTFEPTSHSFLNRGKQEGSNPNPFSFLTEAPASSAPPIFPFLFITIACGAISGFHGLVSSGTTAKQLDQMGDCQYVGYGGMVGEGILGLTSVLACTAGFTLLAERKDGSPMEIWQTHYSSWGGANDFSAKISAFVEGGGEFLTAVPGVTHETAIAIVAIIVISFAATTLDSAARIQRYIIRELAERFNAGSLGGRYGRGAIAALTPLLLVFGSAWMALWPMFGATNQMLAGLSMLVVTVYLLRKKRRTLNYVIPMIFLILATGAALVINSIGFFKNGFLGPRFAFQDILLSVLSAGLFFISIWIIAEGFLQIRAGPNKEDSSRN